MRLYGTELSGTTAASDAIYNLMDSLMYTITSTKCVKEPLNANIEDLLHSRKKILGLVKRDTATSTCVEYPRKDIESSITLTPGKLLSTAKSSKLSVILKYCLFNDNSVRRRTFKVKWNEGDNNEEVDAETNGLVAEHAHRPRRESNFDIDFYQPNGSVSTIKEGESYSEEDKDEFRTARSNENGESLILRLEGLDLAEENTKLKRENERLREKHEQEASKLRRELAETRSELKKVLRRLNEKTPTPP
eukprot:TRINITY_DN9802_c0_g3_i2.p1 TRINITY_DN9802_c0_g3~~TRINITY_DN9802_c0_g3_i2.p1  ORF type:complete len:248 (-),score=46.70 TRINITY_DN9802_c0_g3_i2:167-910(-)